MGMRSRSLVRFLPLLLASALAAPQAGAQGADSLLHEQIPDDANENDLDSWLAEGALPTRIDTPDGPTRPADPTRPPAANELPYARGSVRVDTAPSATFEPDRDTRRPEVLPYDDPFTPRIEPFKRLSAFDDIDASYTLRVHEQRPELVAVDGGTVRPHEDSFYADLVLDLAGVRAVRIPTPGAGARLLAIRATSGASAVPVSVQKDSADNWYVTSPVSGRVRLVYQTAVDRDALGGVFPEQRSPAQAVRLPPNVASAADEVLRTLGVDRAQSFRTQLSTLVSYFRSFEESDVPLHATRDVYRDLALGKKGVCRHRAFAFFVTARALGIPTRLVLNEAHAWVEVHDGVRFRRVDLGGAGRALSRKDADKNVPDHTPPDDPFAWPEGATRGADLHGSGGGGGPTEAGDGVPVPTPRENDRRPQSAFAFRVAEPLATRGEGVAVDGRVTEAGTTIPCPHLSVRLVLTHGEARTSAAKNRRVLLGELVTDDHGDFHGAPVLPSSVATGTWDLIAETVGDARCGIGSSDDKPSK